MRKIEGHMRPIRKSRVEWISVTATYNCHSWHLFDGLDQEQRDERVGRSPLGLKNEGWYGKHVDDLRTRRRSLVEVAPSRHSARQTESSMLEAPP
jgi:hypothetical protein